MTAETLIKTIVAIILVGAVITVIACFSGCEVKTEKTEKTAASGGKISVPENL